MAALREGAPLNSVTRMFNVSIHTVLRVVRETGEAFLDYMDRELRDLPCQRIELDEQWQYVGCHAGRMIAPDKERGDFWLWAAIDADTKLVPSFKVGKRDRATANAFVSDVASRLTKRVQISSDALKAYEDAIESFKRLHASGFCIGIVSQGVTIKQAEKLVRMRILPYVDKRAIFFMNREKEIESAITLSQVDFYRSCSLALGAFVYAQFVVTRDGYARLTDLSVNVSEQS